MTENRLLSPGESRTEQTGASASLFRRMWKYKLHYVIVWPAFLLLIIFKIIPFINALRLPFVNYNPVRGISGSERVGWANMTKLFSDLAFRNVIENTLTLKLAYIVAGGIIAFVIALALSGIKSAKLRNAFATLFLVPYFLPSLVVAYIAILAVSPFNSPLFRIDAFVFGDNRLFPFALVAIEVIKTCGIPILMALAAIGWRHAASARTESGLGGIGAVRLASPSDIGVERAGGSYARLNVIPAARAIAAFILMQLSTILSTDFELIQSLYSPLVYQAGDTLDTYMYRIGLINVDYSVLAVGWLVQFVVQLLFTLLAYVIVRGLFARDLFCQPTNTSAGIQANRTAGASFAGIGIAIVYSLIVLVLLYLLFVYPWITHSSSEIGLPQLFASSTFIVYALLNMAAVFVFMLITVTLAYPLTVKDLPGRGLYRAFLLIVMLMGTGSLHEYLFYRGAGMINTVFPQVFGGFFAIISVFVLKSIFNSKYSALKEEAAASGRGELHAFFTLFIPKIWKQLLALGVLQFVALWNSFYPSLLYMANPDRQSPVMLFRVISTGIRLSDINPADPIILQYGAVLCALPVVLLLLFRKWLTSEVFISQIRKL